MSRRIAIVGTRAPTPEQVAAVRRLITGLSGDEVIVSGAARGIDSIAATTARAHGHTVVEYPAAWGFHGRAAGPIRNARIVADCDEMHAFPGDGPGTRDAIAQAKRAGKVVTVHPQNVSGDRVDPVASNSGNGGRPP